MVGEGVVTWPGVKVYEGPVKEGKATGSGSIVFTDGRIYKGQVENGIATGQGRFDYPDGISYEGSVLNDKPEGKGTFIWANGLKFDRKATGTGSLICLDGTTYHNFNSTNLIDNMTCSQISYSNGNMTLADGTSYRGDIENGQIVGIGEKTWPEGHPMFFKTYKGVLIGGKAEKKGKLV
jgi:hypothetical protein